MFQVTSQAVPLASQNLPPSELHMGVCGRPPMPSVLRRIPLPPCYPFPIPVSRPQFRPPFEPGDHLRPVVPPPCYPFPIPVSRPQFRPPFEPGDHLRPVAPCEPVFMPQPVPVPDPWLQVRGVPPLEPTLRFPCRPPVISPFDASRQSCPLDASSFVFPRMPVLPSRPVISPVRQPFLLPQTADHQFQPVTVMPELNVSGHSVSFEASFMPSFSDESAVNTTVTQDQAKDCRSDSDAVHEQSQHVTDRRQNLDSRPPKSLKRKRDSDSSEVCQSDEGKSPSGQRDRKRRRGPVRSPRSRESRGNASSSRERYKDSGRQRASRLENR